MFQVPAVHGTTRKSTYEMSSASTLHAFAPQPRKLLVCGLPVLAFRGDVLRDMLGMGGVLCPNEGGFVTIISIWNKTNGFCLCKRRDAEAMSTLMRMNRFIASGSWFHCLILPRGKKTLWGDTHAEAPKVCSSLALFLLRALLLNMCEIRPSVTHTAHDIKQQRRAERNKRVQACGRREG